MKYQGAGDPHLEADLHAVLKSWHAPNLDVSALTSRLPLSPTRRHQGQAMAECTPPTITG